MNTNSLNTNGLTSTGANSLASGTAATTLTATTATAGAGFRNATSRQIVANKSVAPVDATGGITATVTQVLDGSIFTAATSVAVTLPTAAGAAGIVQNLPGTPAVGDEIQIILVENHATNTLTLTAGAGSTVFGIATVTNGSRVWTGRVTSVAANSETITWY